MTIAAPLNLPKRRNGLVAFAAAQPVGAACLVFIAMLIGASIFAEWIVPNDPFSLDFGALLMPPSWQYPFGTDNMGRCVFSRVVYGARTALVIGILSSLVGSVVGGLIGVVQGYFGGRFDFYVSRFIDILLSFPIIVLAVVVVAMLGKRAVGGVDINLVVAIAIPIVPKVARVVRSSALSIRELPYIDAARAAGFSHARIVLRHMVPNVFAPFIIMFTAFVAQAILLEASLSFLGLGVTEPTPAWGLMLAGNAADFYREAPWMIIFPGLAISLSVFAFNLFGDALRDYLDPRFKV
ncbi:ABC transporter permease [Phreatobacter sp. AB_2022a]|uniref:ABC transporter permease n=1 Tax=Phreatobacter sp. AB_2022a TaxID=3003134 RepID=UPI0022873549|nr:ABC transporter permease [Phreatobacter sp. AB_2022a]MCZ0733737.1 ABC transporter permease [Phreatobacter sp. AB_2022a]